MTDNVNHPAHYETGKFECIEVMLETQGVEAVLNFCQCNAFKYLYRAKRKNGLEDMKKAVWYLNKYIELKEGHNYDESITGRRVTAHSSRSPIMTEQCSCISIVRAIPSRTISISWRSPKVSHRTAFGSS